MLQWLGLWGTCQRIRAVQDACLKSLLVPPNGEFAWTGSCSNVSHHGNHFFRKQLSCDWKVAIFSSICGPGSKHIIYPLLSFCLCLWKHYFFSLLGVPSTAVPCPPSCPLNFCVLKTVLVKTSYVHKLIHWNKQQIDHKCIILIVISGSSRYLAMALASNAKSGIHMQRVCLALQSGKDWRN